MKALLVLEDGFSLEGRAFAGSGEAYGEVVFNTSMSGYQEIITDPSYKGQIVTFTYPLIGNYGANEEDSESARPQVEAVIIREYSRFPSNWRASRTLLDYLEAHGVLGIEDMDTRALTRHVREAGAMRGVVSTTDLDHESLQRKVRSYPGLVGQDMVKRVTCAREYTWNSSGRQRVVALDFGVKRSILRMLEEAGCQVTVVPAYTPAGDVLGMDPDGIFLSNGPGDPAGVPAVVEEVAKLVGKRPIFGICLGHQILGLAMGLSTFKLKYGHRGANHPVRNLDTGKVEITSQNHGFCVRAPESPAAVRITHVNLNDGTVEGMEVPGKSCFSVQYHPEASPGPHDSRYLFERFVRMMDGSRGDRRRDRAAEAGISVGRGVA